MTASAFDASAPEPADVSAGGYAFDRVRRLVPASGIQFIDVTMDTRQLPMLRAWYTEDEIFSPAGSRRVLLPLSHDANADGTIWHPVTFRPLGPSETLSYTGLEALDPFLDTWVPVPFLRYLGTAEQGGASFDQGPFNWARVFVAKPEGGLRSATTLQAVFAFDTRLDSRSRADQSAYLAPNADDALFASTFMLADHPEELADFLSQPWIDAWVRDICTAKSEPFSPGAFDDPVPSEADAVASRFTLAHVARYLTFLKLLRRAAAPPQIRFIDSISKSLPLATAAIDLVIDFGAAETTALLIERSRPLPPGIADASRHAFPLRLRDLTEPVQIHTGPIATLVEFDNQTFGNAALSRRSGRTDAFAWTSLVRVGQEARKLSLRANATEGVTGHAEIAGQLDQTDASDVIWRFSTPDQSGAKTGPMVTGETLRHISESGDMMPRPDGLLTGPASANGLVPVTRPRFSQSALVGFYIVELLLHAISEINAAGPGSPFADAGGERTGIRQLDRVIITTPVSMPQSERRILIDRVHGAIELVWRSQLWDQPGPFAQPSKPQLLLGIGPDIGLQLVYLFNEVRTKFGGAFTDLVDCVRRRTGDLDARDNLRISSMELNRRTAGLTVIDYDVSHDGAVQAELVLADRTGVGGERVVEAIVEHFILTAVETELAACGVPDARRFLLGLIAVAEGPQSANPLGRRLVSKVLRPAAAGVFETYAGMPRRGAEGLRRFRLEHLVEASGGRLEPVAQQFEAAAAKAGAKDFKLGAVCFDVSRRQLRRLVETELWPTVNAMTDAIISSESDILLMGGDLAELPDLLDHLLTRAPVPAGRIVVLGTRERRAANAAGNDRNIPQDHAVLAAYMASRNMLHDDGFALLTQEITRNISSDGRMQQQGLGGPGAGGGWSAAGQTTLAFPAGGRPDRTVEASILTGDDDMIADVQPIGRVR